MSNNDLIYQIALTKVKQIGDYHARILLNHFDSAEQVFLASKKQLEKIDGIGTVRASFIKSFKNFRACEQEMIKMERADIHSLFIKDTNYPKRLAEIIDAPTLIYFKGQFDTITRKSISIVGTRGNTAYGKEICEDIIAGLSKFSVNIVSGLAYGIDTIAHTAALKNNLPTLAILAHGLDSIYPISNKSLSEKIIFNGGLLTEFRLGTPPDKPNFPKRNRITAGICDALIVIESGSKGGSLISASIAHSYHKEVFAVPGRMNDYKNEGCNQLIKENKAMILTSAEDIAKELGWNTSNNIKNIPQLSFNFELNEIEKEIINLFDTQSPIHIDLIIKKMMISPGQVHQGLLNLEMKNLIKSLPGNQYCVR